MILAEFSDSFILISNKIVPPSLIHLILFIFIIIIHSGLSKSGLSNTIFDFR